MARKPNPGRREQLEDALVSYVLAHGIANLSLRPVAEALDVSTYALVYHFGSREGLIAAIMARIEEQQRTMTAGWLDDPASATLPALMRRYWDEWCLPGERAAYHRLFYEIFALSLQRSDRFPGFLERGALPWLSAVRDLALRAGVDEVEARSVATLMTSTIVGALLVMLGTGDKAAATRAVYAAADHVAMLVSRNASGT